MTMPARVLVVDDSPLIRTVVRRQLEIHGFAVVEAGDGSAALELARTDAPDVVILDIEMPGLDGRSVLQTMQHDDKLAHVPVIFLTGRTDLGDVIAGLDSGAHDYLAKPFEPGELLARVRGAVRVKQLTDELRRQNLRLEQLARTDVLTGLPNRRHLEERLRAAISQSVRHGQPVSVAILDVDRFKSINDDLGHAAGDTVLVEVATRMTRGSRLEDVVGRWGGEEFLAVLPVTDAAGAVQAAERLRAVVAATPVPIGNGEGRVVTISAGCALAAGDLDDVVRRADEALYEAKAAGRNTVRAR